MARAEPVDRYLEVNRANWDERAPAHAASPDVTISQVQRQRQVIDLTKVPCFPAVSCALGQAAMHALPGRTLKTKQQHTDGRPRPRDARGAG